MLLVFSLLARRRCCIDPLKPPPKADIHNDSCESEFRSNYCPNTDEQRKQDQFWTKAVQMHFWRTVSRMRLCHTCNKK